MELTYSAHNIHTVCLKVWVRHLFEFFLIVYWVHLQYNLLYEKYLQACYCLLNFLYSCWSASDSSVLFLYDRLAFFSLSFSTVSNTRFIAAVIERHTHSPERRRRYWGRSGTESDHGKRTCVCVSMHSSLKLWRKNGISRFEKILLKRGS